MRKDLIIVLAFLLVLASCTTGDNGPVANQKTFLGGNTGIVASFVAGEPPESVTDGGSTPFTVTVKLENKGESAISKDKIALSLKGFDAGDFDIQDINLLTVHPDEDVLKNDINPDNGQAINSPPVYVTIPNQGALNFKSQLSGNSVFPLQVGVCYDYQTKATSNLCIKENLLDSEDKNVCVVSEKKQVQNSGGPIQISGFEEFTAGPDKVSFTITLKNVGGGFLSKEASGCDDSPANENIVKLTVDAGLSGLTCSGLTGGAASGTAYAGEVKLTMGERQVRCTQPIVQKSDKIKIVDITVNYGYEESITKNLLVKHIA